MNWHANANSLETNSTDSLIKYFYHTGLPPTRSGTPINSTSNNAWTTISYQTQDPYILHKKDFFGPEITLARALYTEFENMAVIKTAYAGTSLAADWKKGRNSGNQLYKLMMSQIDTATSLLTKDGITYEFEGFFWMQGESDAANANYANNYHSNLEDFIMDIRTDLNTPDLKFVLGRIGDASSYPHKEQVRDTQVDVAGSDSLVDWVDTDDLPLDTDNVHLIAEGVKLLGSRMASAWINLPSIVVSNEEIDIENKVSLSQNFPNPFNPVTTISFELPYTSIVQLIVYNQLGQEVATLINTKMIAGEHHVSFDASLLSSGVYIYRLFTEKYHFSRKMVLIK
ncbi:MAG: sialate O-acetylesterase [Balneola sp.]